MIDYPGFNLRLARALRRQSQRYNRIHYISPQVWAWNRGRIKKIAQFPFDLVLCIFPLLIDPLHAASGLRAVFVGHPMIERLDMQKIDTHRDQNLIGLFPGSRSREVRKIFPVMIEAAVDRRNSIRLCAFKSQLHPKTSHARFREKMRQSN